MLNAANGRSRLGCTVAAKFSRQFSDEVSWQKVDPQAAAAASGEEDITEGGAGQGGNQGGGTTGTGIAVAARKSKPDEKSTNTTDF